MTRLITDPQELRALLLEGLTRYLKQRNRTMKKLLVMPFAQLGIKAKPPFPALEWLDRLDALLAAAQKAGVSPYQIAEALDQRADATRMRIALCTPSDRGLA